MRFHQLLFFMCATRLFSINVQTKLLPVFQLSINFINFRCTQCVCVCAASAWCRQRQIKPHSVSMVGYLYSKCFLAWFMLKWFHFIWKWLDTCVSKLGPSYAMYSLGYPSCHVKKQKHKQWNALLYSIRFRCLVERAQISLQCQNMLDLHLLDVAVVTIRQIHTHRNRIAMH